MRSIKHERALQYTLVVFDRFDKVGPEIRRSKYALIKAEPIKLTSTLKFGVHMTHLHMKMDKVTQ